MGKQHKQHHKKKKSEKHKKITIQASLDLFVRRLESLFRILPLVMFMINGAIEAANTELDNFLKEKKVQKRRRKKHIDLKISIEDAPVALRLIRQLDTAEMAQITVPRMFLVSLISEYDAFLWNLIKSIFYLRPELLDISEKNISFKQLTSFNTIEDAREYMVEKEVESVLRKSHADHFIWLEKKLGMTLRKGLDVWPLFIEVTERRNLFVHCDGVVSNQYVNICKEHKVEIEDSCKVGEKLTVTPDYFLKAYNCIFEIGVKLAHVIWRKLLEDERKLADEDLIDICYNLLYYEQYDLAIKLLDFATEVLKKYSDDEMRRIFIINRAIAYKFKYGNDKMNEIIDKEDWTACGDKFKLAIAVLKDDYKLASNLMEKIGKSGEVRKEHYKDWPLFKEFRKRSEFLESYQKIFNEPYMSFDMPRYKTKKQ